MIDDIPYDIIREILFKVSAFERVKLSMTCSTLKHISCMHEFEYFHQMRSKHYVNNQILYLNKEWNDLWKIKNSNTHYFPIVWLPKNFTTFILTQNLTKKKLSSKKYAINKDVMNHDTIGWHHYLHTREVINQDVINNFININ
jgi:hypothetical protein